jgi:bacterial/archaeal transporter family-2 protein
MLDSILTILIGLLGGISVGIQSPLAGAISQRVGGVASSFIIHASGAVFSGVLLLLRGGENIRAVGTLPFYMFGAGAFGLLLYLTISHTMPKLGAGAAVMLIIAGQLLIGLLIDHYGWLDATVRPIEPTRVLAVLLVLGGAYLLAR